MSEDERPKLPAVRPDSDYGVGYGKPPVDSRFKPGKSGNPQGRPKGSKNKRPKLKEERLKSIILEEAYRDISVRDGDRNVSIPMAQAIVRALAVKAAKGDLRAQRLFSEMLATTERQRKELADEWVKTAIDYKIVWEDELKRRERAGITDLPDPLPHPDQIKIDFKSGEAWVQGPMTKEDKADLDLWVKCRDDWQEELQECQKLLETEEDESMQDMICRDITHAKKMIGLIDSLLEKSGYCI